MSEVTTSTERVKKAKPIQCRVVTDKMNKSRVAEVDRLVKHARYGKFLRRTTRLMFHDETNSTKVGDVVLVESSRPLSAHKKFKLVQIVEKARE
jgi:small subunit ribosomal protein S17